MRIMPYLHIIMHKLFIFRRIMPSMHMMLNLRLNINKLIILRIIIYFMHIMLDYNKICLT